MTRSQFLGLFSLALLSAFLLALPTFAASPQKSSKIKIKKAPHETVIFVDDLHCKNCAKKMARKLYAVKGVVKVRTDLKADVAIVTPQKKKQLDPLALWKAAKTAGFPAIKLVGPDGTYLPNPETKAAEKQANSQG